MSKTNLIFIAGIVVGCVTAKVAPISIEIPVAKAGNTAKYENWCVSPDNTVPDFFNKGVGEAKVGGWNSYLKKVNGNGWELVSLSFTGYSESALIACFKREI